ncbi:MAG: hypothetical protein QM526_00875 [Alphaproteobacteria bacterium]|nr:hypothetical protein [Alphaproteobacteria bacterium]
MIKKFSGSVLIIVMVMVITLIGISILLAQITQNRFTRGVLYDDSFQASLMAEVGIECAQVAIGGTYVFSYNTAQCTPLFIENKTSFMRVWGAQKSSGGIATTNTVVRPCADVEVTIVPAVGTKTSPGTYKPSSAKITSVGYAWCNGSNTSTTYRSLAVQQLNERATIAP